jgi:hypothetical protein
MPWRKDVAGARSHALRLFAAGALLTVGVLAVWCYENYRHRITLGPTDTIVLADIENRTGDPVFDGALNNALRLEMEQTPYLNVLGLDKMYARMALLKLSPSTAITPEIAAARQTARWWSLTQLPTQVTDIAWKSEHSTATPERPWQRRTPKSPLVIK